MADTPQFLTLAANRDRTERRELVFRRIFFSLLLLVLVAALLNAFGQRPTTTQASTSAADLEVFAPERLRGGIYYQGRITVEAKQEIEKVILVVVFVSILPGLVEYAKARARAARAPAPPPEP